MNETIKKFIIQEIEKISGKFPHISFKYGFDKMGKQHLIEVEPDTEFKNQEYMEAEFDIVDSFIYKFPEDDILFISNNKYIHIDKVVYIKEGTIQVAVQLISTSDVHDNNSLIPAPFFFQEYFAIATLNNVKVCDPIPKNKNNIIESELNRGLNYNNSYAMAA